MKLYFLLILLMPLSSFAAQKNIGKRVIYRMIFDGRDQGVAITDIVSMTEENTYQRETQLYIEETEEFILKEIEGDEIAMAESTSHIVRNCKKLSGKTERIYASGRLQEACKLSVHHKSAKERLALLDFNEKDLSDGFVWLGKVPLYGILKLNSPELILDLTYYRWKN